MTVATATPPPDAPSSRDGWLVAAALGAAASIYLPVLTGLVRQWYEDPDAAYGCVVAVAAVIAARQRWPRLRQAPVGGSWWGAAALAAALAWYAVATLAADVFLLRTSAVVLLGSALWFVRGAASLRAMAAPLALALVAIPPPSAVVTEATLPLQLAASQIAAGLLGTMGMDVVREGNVLALGSITLEVAEACSGMRSLVTLFALVAVYGAICRPPLSRAAILAAATIPVALAGNALRLAATAVLATRIGEDATRGLVHDATGIVAFIVMAAALVAAAVVSGRYLRTAAA